MKIRDSGMPDARMWEGFFDAPRILAALGSGGVAGDTVEFGCGYGTFTVAAAAVTRGMVRAFDIEPAMVAATRARAAAAGLQNVEVAERDFIAAGTGLANASADCALLFNILHAAEPVPLLREAARVLRPGGRALVIHWVCDRPTPRGPALAIRPRPAQCAAWLVEAGFTVSRAEVDLPPWHYGVVGERRGSTAARTASSENSQRLLI
ncbi:MAG TPA: class I SAM-dependent methyltransferase [Rhodanobacteraceae bacterium]|nr:class I SAM-dependent methyltransferase [Rhodanobacteraceae bacterium]